MLERTRIVPDVFISPSVAGLFVTEVVETAIFLGSLYVQKMFLTLPYECVCSLFNEASWIEYYFYE